LPSFDRLDRVVGLDRNIALVRSSLGQVKQIAHRHDATVNDVLLAATAGGLRALLRSRGELVEDLVVPIYVPVSLRRSPSGPQQGNLIAQMVVPLPLGESDSGHRLRQIAAATAARKSRRRTSLGTLIRGPRIVRRLMLKAVLQQRVNATSASIPGPTRPLYLSGARLLEAFPVLPLVANEPLGIDATSCYEKNQIPCELTTAELEDNTPYDTRNQVGLPPTPIASPGRDSLYAALNPAEGDWHWYVLDVEAGDGSSLFTNDYEEFQAAKERCVEAGKCG